MKEQVTIIYEPPRVEVIEVQVEKGFTLSGQGTDTNGYYDFGERS